MCKSCCASVHDSVQKAKTLKNRGWNENQSDRKLKENNFRGNKFRQVYLANTAVDSRMKKIKMPSLRLFPRLQISSGWLGWGFTLLSKESKVIFQAVKSLSTGTPVVL